MGARRRKKANVDLDIDMTPMIDMTFLLIIFFIIVNDLSKKELEELKLPIAYEAGHDQPPPNRQILNVRWFPAGGVPKSVQDYYQRYLNVTVPSNQEWSDIVWKGQVLYYPQYPTQGRMDPIRPTRPDFYWKLAATMEDEWVPYMEKEPAEELGGELLPDDPILIRADRNTPFKYVQKIMEVCTREGIRIWKVQLAASEDPAKVAAREAAEN